VPGKSITIRSRDGGAFACYLVTPETDGQVSAVVLASTVHGVDADIREIADEFAAFGFIAAAPDLFWRSITGPQSQHVHRVVQHAPSRLEQIKSGEADMADTLGHLGALPMFNGSAAAMGFCYGGPYAILGPKRLGYAAGVSCHGTQMLDYIEELNGVGEPVCVIWGDQDHRAPVEVLNAYHAIPSRMKNVEVHIFPGVHHGYMMRGSPKAFDRATRDFSMGRAVAILGGLRDGSVSQSIA
jgi:carboxymethylenebutenolidase